jgi:hypothetical protein
MSGLLIYLTLQAFSVLGAAFAVWKGRAAERMAAAVVVANVLIGLAGQWLAPDSGAIVRLCNDGLAAAALLVVTLRFGALWTGGVMLFYAAQFSLHSYYLVTEQAPDYLYALINNINWSGIIWCLIIGTAVAWRRRVRADHLAGQPAL